MSKIEITTKKFGIRVFAEGTVAIIITVTMAIVVLWIVFLKTY